MALHSSRVSLELGSAQPWQLYNLHLAGTYSQTYCAQNWPSLSGLDPVEANFEGAPEEVRPAPPMLALLMWSTGMQLPWSHSWVSPAMFQLQALCNRVFSRRDLHEEKLTAVLNISGFGTKQQVGHLDFFPDGREEMPGCRKNALSQIIDLDGIWAGKGWAEWGNHFPGDQCHSHSKA